MSTIQPPVMGAHSRRAHLAAISAYFALLLLVVVWHGWLSPSGGLPRALAVLFAGGPLMFPLRGLLHQRPYTHAWTSYLALGYFVHGVVEAYSAAPERPLALAEVSLSVVLFVGAILFARLRARELRAAATMEQAVS